MQVMTQLADYTEQQIADFLDSDDPPPAPLTRKQIREALITRLDDRHERAMATARWVCESLMPWLCERRQLAMDCKTCATVWRDSIL
jgi:hypothetical protein